MGKGGQTIGYHYMFDILFGLARGPLNDLRAIKIGDKIAWEGPQCEDGCTAIRKPDLFGGEKKEGGIQGPFRVLWGGKDQVLPGACAVDCGWTGPMKGVRTLPALKTAIGGLMSELRGTSMVWFSGLVTSMNPYPKQWEFRVRRYSAGWYDDVCWYPAKSLINLKGTTEATATPALTKEEIELIMLARWAGSDWTPPQLASPDGDIRAMNGAHIIFQCLTDPQWGRGYAWTDLDENSFIYAANTLCAEGFGLCLAWQRDDQNVDEFIDMVCDLIGAVYYTDPETGKIVLRLIREDYDPEALPLFTPESGLLDIVDDDSTGSDEAFNEIIGTGRDPITNEDFMVRVHNLAARISQGAPNAQKKDYKGIPTKELLARVLMRDLRITALGLKKFKVVLDRRGWQLRPGMPFRIADPRRNIGNIILRAGQIEDKSFKDGRITISAMQDVYGLPATSFVTVVDPTWTPPPTEAPPAVAQRLIEANHRDIARRADSATLDSMTDTDSVAGVVALSPDPAIYRFDLAMRAEGEGEYQISEGAFAGAAKLAANVGILDGSFVVTGAVDFGADNVGQAILVDDEQMELTAWDEATQTATVNRGCADTVPATHLAGAYAWTVDDEISSDRRRYASGETVEAAVLPRTSSDMLDLADATVMTLALSARQARPYPPAKITVDGDEALTLDPTIVHSEPVLDWAHRDRLLQQDQLVGYAEPSVGPEPGTTYNIRVYASTDPATPLRTETGLAAGPWTYDAAKQTADGTPRVVIFELESQRDGLKSFQQQRFTVRLIEGGWGFGWGFDWGGA